MLKDQLQASNLAYVEEGTPKPKVQTRIHTSQGIFLTMLQA